MDSQLAFLMSLKSVGPVPSPHTEDDQLDPGSCGRVAGFHWPRSLPVSTLPVVLDSKYLLVYMAG